MHVAYLCGSNGNVFRGFSAVCSSNNTKKYLCTVYTYNMYNNSYDDDENGDDDGSLTVDDDDDGGLSLVRSLPVRVWSAAQHNTHLAAPSTKTSSSSWVICARVVFVHDGPHDREWVLNTKQREGACERCPEFMNVK